jgi:hypothetical protein
MTLLAEWKTSVFFRTSLARKDAAKATGLTYPQLADLLGISRRKFVASTLPEEHIYTLNLLGGPHSYAIRKMLEVKNDKCSEWYHLPRH